MNKLWYDFFNTSNEKSNTSKEKSERNYHYTTLEAQEDYENEIHDILWTDYFE
jgi:hypothetical protein